MTESELLNRVCRIMLCDKAQVIRFDHIPRMFLICGWNRRSEGEWFRSSTMLFAVEDGICPSDAEPVHFDYLEEKCLASGDTLEALWRGIKSYRRLQRFEKIKDPVKRVLKMLDVE